MGNEFRNIPFEEPVVSDEQEQEDELQPSLVQSDTTLAKSAWNRFLSDLVTKEKATQMLPFVFFLAFLAMVYIASHHYVTKHIREIDQLTKEVKELSWDYKTLKADLMLRSTQSSVAKRVDSAGLKESLDAPEVIVLKSQ